MFERLKKRLAVLFEMYGRVAFVTYFALFFLTWGGFAAAISLGYEVKGAAGSAGLVGASYLAAKLTQPLRILLTLVVTPLVGKLVRRAPRGPHAP